MIDDEEERIALELSRHFREIRNNANTGMFGADHPAQLLAYFSDGDIESISRLFAPFLVDQILGRRSVTEQDFHRLATSILSTPGLFAAFAKAASTEGMATYLRPPDVDHDGAMLFYRKAVKKLEYEQFKEARTLLKKSIDLCDNFAPAWEALSQALDGCGQHEESKLAATRAQQLKTLG
jgi:hypothetical protein